MHQGSRGDAVDRARMHAAVAAAAAVAAGGIGAVLGVRFLEGCGPCDGSWLPVAGIIPAWALAMAVAAGRLAWTRSLGAGVAGACLLAWVALHFGPGQWIGLYEPAVWWTDAAGWSIGFLGYWLLAAAAMVGGVLGVGWAVDRMAGRPAP